MNVVSHSFSHGVGIGFLICFTVAAAIGLRYDLKGEREKATVFYRIMFLLMFPVLAIIIATVAEIVLKH